VVVVDANGLQGFGSTRDVMNLEPLADKWRSFGFDVAVAPDGNSFFDLDKAFYKFELQSPRPRCIVAKTIKGHGVSYMSDRMEWHYLPMSPDQYEIALKETQLIFEKNRDA
jgi:transketolase